MYIYFYSQIFLEFLGSFFFDYTILVATTMSYEKNQFTIDES